MPPIKIDGEWADESDIRIGAAMGRQLRMVRTCERSAELFRRLGEERTATMYELMRWNPIWIVEIAMNLFYPPPNDGGVEKRAPRPAPEGSTNGT